MLDVQLAFTSIHQLEILRNGMVLTRVVCSQYAGFALSNISKVKIDGLAFVTCGRSGSFGTHFTTYYGLHLQSVLMAKIIDCTFQDSYGTALGVEDSHVVLRGSNFYNNCRLCSNRKCGKFSPKCYGGGVFVNRSNLTITGSSIFLGNSAYNGGGIYANFESNITISENTTFISNSASGGEAEGGGIYAYRSNVKVSGNTTFINNSAERNGGGIILERASSIIINGNTTFINNSVSDREALAWLRRRFTNTTFIGKSSSGGVHTLGRRGIFAEFFAKLGKNGQRHGGGIYMWSNSNANISGNTTFIGNSATLSGGGVYVGSKSNMYISGNTAFVGNSASAGGGVYADFNVAISGNTDFIGNSASRDGGGVSAGSYCIVTITGNTTFIGNSAMNGGGFYAESNSNVKVNGITAFIGNSATVGGGFYVGSSSNVQIYGNNTFSSNSAVHGGCMFLNTSLSLEGDCTFTNCYARYGGAIYATEIQANFSGTDVFMANTAAHFGGGLYAHKSYLNLPGDNIFIANSAGTKGGGIYAQETKITFSGTGLLSGNVAQLDGGGLYADGSNLNFSGNLTITNNTAGLGGGVYLDNNTFIIDGNNVVDNNFATFYGGGFYIRRSPLIVAGDNMLIANSAREGGAIYATANSTLSLDGKNTFIGNRAYVSGGGIWFDNSNLILIGIQHFVDCVASYEGGAIFAYAATASLHGNSTFESNSATTGGGIHARWSNFSVTNSSNFRYNIAVFGGGIFTDNSTFEFNDSSTFRGNQANHTGGGIYASRSILCFYGISFITANFAARDGGGIYTRDDCVVNLLGLSNYQNNLAEDTGGGVSAFRSSFNLAGKNSFRSNHAVIGGAFYTVKCIVKLLGENSFITNTASYHGGGFTVMHSTVYLSGSTSFSNNSATSGGGMYIGDGTLYVDTDGNNCFINNTAELGGGGILSMNSFVELNGKSTFVSNSAGSKGAAIHMSFTNLIIGGSSSFVGNSAEYGGGIHSESSNLTFVHHGSNRLTKLSPSCKSVCNGLSTIPRNVFLNNTALRGGAHYFDLNSNFSLHQSAHIRFQDNHAIEFGGAIYAADLPGPGQFLSQQHIPFRSEGFFHILKKDPLPDMETTPLVFQNNSARIRGGVLYGGLLEKCNFTSDRYTSALQLFNMSIVHSKNDMGHSISSDPTQLCFCNMNKLSCTEVTQYRSIYPGQQVVVSVVAIDQSGLTIPTLIHIKICSGPNLTVSETVSYKTGRNCTSRNYSITPKNLFNQLELYPSNRSGNTIHLIVNIIFESCPIGFEQSNSTGECICDRTLWQYTNSCSIDRQAILRNASRTFWIGISYINGTLEGFIHHRYCPLDYCTSESNYINLNNPDKQCNSNRSGLLCGKCKEGLSLVLGSSQCNKCSNKYLALLIPFAVAGVLLVILLFLFHLTVAEGTLHGLIFYANVVAANHHIFFPHTSNNPASIFIAWLNLDLGIQTCFYNGMDAYGKTWLEFVFPVYIWVIVGFLAYISHHSVTATKLLGSSPVPVLATLFLLSYAKILRTIIAALSLTILHYPHKNVVVWIHDANVPLAKYTPLVVVALLFLLFLFLPYTMLLLLGQWLQRKSHYCLLSWVRNHKLKAVLDTYHAPYKPNHRYWTGLLLLLRCALFLVVAFNVSGDHSINLLVISSATIGIFVGFALLGKVYKSWYLNALELSFILNVSMLAVATYHVNQSGGSQAAVAYTSVGIAFLTFVGIITYHIYIRIKSKLQYIQRVKKLQRGKNKCHKNNNNDNPEDLCHQTGATPGVTHTEVNLHELRPPLDLLSYHQMH